MIPSSWKRCRKVRHLMWKMGSLMASSMASRLLLKAWGHLYHPHTSWESGFHLQALLAKEGKGDHQGKVVCHLARAVHPAKGDPQAKEALQPARVLEREALRSLDWLLERELLQQGRGHRRPQEAKEAPHQGKARGQASS
jgi:hypothetical protein